MTTTMQAVNLNVRQYTDCGWYTFRNHMNQLIDRAMYYAAQRVDGKYSIQPDKEGSWKIVTLPRVRKVDSTVDFIKTLREDVIEVINNDRFIEEDEKETALTFAKHEINCMITDKSHRIDWFQRYWNPED